MTSLHWYPSTRNSKTGNVPTATITGDRQERDSTCKGCPLFPRARGGTGDRMRCYSQGGTASMGDASKRRNGPLPRASLAAVLGSAVRSARMVRATAIGDLARCNPADLVEDYRTARGAGLAWVAYTHFPESLEHEHGSEGRAYACASIETPSMGGARTWRARMLALLGRDWRATVTCKPDEVADVKRDVKRAGYSVIECPAIAASRRGKHLTCNDCRLCDPDKPGPDVIVFADHGPTRPRGGQ